MTAPKNTDDGYFAGDYQINGYVGNEAFWVSDLLFLENGGFAIVVSRMKGSAAEASRAQVILDNEPVPQNPFPLTTAEQATYSIKGMKFKAGVPHQLVVTIDGGSASTQFTVPKVAEVKFAWPAPTRYFGGSPINLKWKYIPGSMVPSVVKLTVWDDYEPGNPYLSTDLALRETLHGSQRQYQIAGETTSGFSNGLLIEISISDEFFWDFTGTLSLFDGSRVYFINPYDQIVLQKICRDLDRDGYGNPASNLCEYSSYVDDCKDNPWNDYDYCWVIPGLLRACDCDPTQDPNDPNDPYCNACSFCINPGMMEGPDPNAPVCTDAIDNNCNGLIDCISGMEDPGCNCETSP